MNISNTCGLNNIGNTCFMNSALQLLVNCTVLTKFMLNNDFKSKKLNCYKQFLKDYCCNGVITPNTVKLMVSDQNSIFYGYEQQDAHEFLVFLLDIISEELIKEHKSNPNNVLGIDMADLVKLIFNTNITSIIYCEDTDDKSKTKAAENILSLAIGNNKTSLEECLEKFQKIEHLNGDQKWFNDKDSKYYDAYKRLYIKSYPKYLIIHFKRFNYTRFSSKNNTEIEMKENINLKNDNFMLRAIVYHMGNTGGGHYISLVNKNNKWMLCNDSSISEISDISNYINKGYIYLYAKDKK